MMLHVTANPRKAFRSRTLPASESRARSAMLCSDWSEAMWMRLNDKSKTCRFTKLLNVSLSMSDMSLNDKSSRLRAVNWRNKSFSIARIRLHASLTSLRFDLLWKSLGSSALKSFDDKSTAVSIGRPSSVMSDSWLLDRFSPCKLSQPEDWNAVNEFSLASSVCSMSCPCIWSSTRRLCDKSSAFSFVSLLALKCDRKLCDRSTTATVSLIGALKLTLKLVRLANDKFKIKFSVVDETVAGGGDVELLASSGDTIVSRRFRLTVDGWRLPRERSNNKLFTSVLKSNELSSRLLSLFLS